MKYLSLLFFTCLITSSYSQNNGSSYVESFQDKILIKANIDTQTESYSIQNNDSENFSLTANNTFKFTLSANYEFLGLSISLSPKDKNLPYNTSFQDYQARIFVKQWIQNLQYRRVNGFYRDDELPSNNITTFKDFKSISWNAATSYVLNPNFSLKHVLFNTEWQQRSTGSLIPTLRYGYQRISDRINGVTEAQNIYSLSLASEYYYTWVIEEHWFITPAVSPELGLRYYNYYLGNIKDRNTVLTTALNLGLYFGYTSSKIVAGANFNFDSKASNAKTKTNILSDRSYAKLYFGYRFDPPKTLKRKVDWIKNRKKR